MEESHVALEQKLSEFINEPLVEKLEDRGSINDVIDLSRQILKNEWQVTKYPWRPYFKKVRTWISKHL